MRKRLDRITNWPELARQANWSPTQMALLAKASLRTLERYFVWRMGKTPKAWLIEERMARAAAMLAGGFSVKETAADLGYDSPEHFARLFKQRHGHCPCLHASHAKRDADDRMKAA